MKRKTNNEEELISRMMDHLEISKASNDFTQKVMDRVYYESIPAKQSEKPLISKKAWIIVGIVISALFIYLFTGTPADPALPADGESSSFLNLPDLGIYQETIFNWISKTQETLTWYSIGLTALFILTLLERLLKNSRFNRSFVL